MTRRFQDEGLPEGTIQVQLAGHAGQSLGAWLAKGITITLEGDACDYVAKGLSGGIVAIYPPKASTFAAHENIIVGNVCLYGAIRVGPSLLFACWALCSACCLGSTEQLHLPGI